jgi:UDP-N-acetylmuramoyl-tripeptide--D-alanyl-D-alanine ligase
MKDFFRNVVVSILTFEARMVLHYHNPRVIVVSGSVGKTTTKDMLYAALAGSVHVRKSEKSFNSEIGVPLTILGLPNARMSFLGWLENIIHGIGVVLQKQYPDVLVLEVGADHPGDLRRLRWLAPSVTVFTRFPDVPAHVEFFSSPEAVIEEKREMRRALREDGTLCINADDVNMQEEPISETQQRISYGYAESATVQMKEYAHTYTTEGRISGGSVRVTYGKEEQSVQLAGVLGAHYAYSIGAAIAVACDVFRIPMATATSRLSAQSASVYAPGRMRILTGIHGSTLIDDTYNASPAAVRGMIETLKEIPTQQRKIVVLGDMMELGNYAARAHRKAGEQVAEFADLFVAVGARMKEALHAAQQTGNCRTVWFPDAVQAGEFLRDEVGQGDVIALKGSRHAIRMERAVKVLLANKEEEQWLVQT